jgi:hypothetical protein
MRAGIHGALAMCYPGPRSRTRAAAPPTDRPIRDARVPQAIGQSFDWLVAAEAEVLGSRLRSGERCHQHLMLGEDVQARTLWASSPWSLRAREPCGTPLI